MPYLPLCFYCETTGITGSRKENPEGRLMWLFALLSIRNQMTDMYRYCLRVDRIDTGQIWTPCIIFHLWCPSFVAYTECNKNGCYIFEEFNSPNQKADYTLYYQQIVNYSLWKYIIAIIRNYFYCVNCN